LEKLDAPIMSNTYTEAENSAAANAAEYVREMLPGFVGYAAEPDREAAAEALRARVAEMLLGDAFVVVPRYVLADIRKQLEDVQ
jgi:hypothetical protein